MNTDLSCHIIGFNPYSKKEFINNIMSKDINIIDLDNIKKKILDDEIMDKLYTQFQKLKETKNDKFKEVEKKMDEYWRDTFINMVESKVKNKKMNVIIGDNTHYKSLTKRINIDTTNKFLIKNDINKDIENWIKYNLETYKDDIIKGIFPLKYIDHDFLTKRYNNMLSIYKKSGYLEKTMEEVFKIIKSIDNKEKQLWVCDKQPYNINSLYHPLKTNGDKVVAFSEQQQAIINSFKNKKPTNTVRFLYSVEPNTFMFDENSYFSQQPVKIISKIKIKDCETYLKNI